MCGSEPGLRLLNCAEHLHLEPVAWAHLHGFGREGGQRFRAHHVGKMRQALRRGVRGPIGHNPFEVV